MEDTKPHDKIRARDRALSMLNRLTAGAAFAAVAGVGILGAVSANTIPGTATASSTAAASSTTATSSSSSSSGSVSSSSGTGVAVSGGS
ncbi:MAG TPA: hypothetical protein VHJ99_05765 [Candidatus Dormibacteraeota bacterium]|nr:hypothetical protein [Candidatus Dormibacteraeota bacterium]